MQHSNQPVLRADYEHGPRYTVSWPVHRPTIFFLEIVERAFENKNREGFIDRWRKGVGVGKTENIRSFFPFLSRAPPLFPRSELTLATSFYSRACRFSKRKRNDVCVQPNSNALTPDHNRFRIITNFVILYRKS